MWLDRSRLDNKVVKAAKLLPLPRGYFDGAKEEIIRPYFLGESFDEDLERRYKANKRADKCAPEKRKASEDSSSRYKKRRKGNSSW